MGARQRFVISLAEVRDTDEPLVGGKAARLATLSRAGFAVPDGFCLTIEAYQRFLTSAHLGDMIRMELGRKAFGDLRWEEIWDASLRIRSAFAAAAVPAEIASEIADAMGGFPLETHWAVRSTAPGEDSSQRSFAGLHESYLGAMAFTSVLDAVHLVWRPRGRTRPCSIALNWLPISGRRASGPQKITSRRQEEEIRRQYGVRPLAYHRRRARKVLRYLGRTKAQESRCGRYLSIGPHRTFRLSTPVLRVGVAGKSAHIKKYCRILPINPFVKCRG